MGSKRLLLAFSALLIAVIFGCNKDENEEAPTNSDGIQFPEGEAFASLSDYQLFEEPMAELIPVEGLIPYDLNTPLFTDYSIKYRFVYVPSGLQTAYDTTSSLDFPVGSILVKNFSFNLPDGSEKIIETRLLLHRASGWDAETYVWNDEQTAAERVIAGQSLTIELLKPDGSTAISNYAVPNKNQCKNCHATNNDVIPIGPKVANLNKDYDYGADGIRNQLSYWQELGFLEKHLGEHPLWPAWDDQTATLDSRARSYLDVNCAHCHKIDGAASNSGLYLEFYNYDSLSYGFYKSPVAAGPGAGGLDYDIVPGSPEESILYFRQNSNAPEIRMPELGRSIIDEEGLALIYDWIDNME